MSMVYDAVKKIGSGIKFGGTWLIKISLGLALAPIDLIVSPIKGLYDWYHSQKTDIRNPRKYALLASRGIGLVFAAGLIAAFFIPIPGLTALYAMAAIPIMKVLVIASVAVSARTTGAVIGGAKDFADLKNIDNNFKNNKVPSSMSTCQLFAKTFRSIARISVLGGTVASMKSPEPINMDNLSTDKRPPTFKATTIKDDDPNGDHYEDVDPYGDMNSRSYDCRP